MPGPTAAQIVQIVLTDEERRVLESRVRRPKASRALVRRSRIVLACAEGATNGRVAAVLPLMPGTPARTTG